MFGILRPEYAEDAPIAPIAPDISLPPPNSMASPPDGSFATREELLASIKAWAAHQGYAIVIARSRKNRLWLKCDRGGKYENRRNLTPEVRKRKRSESRLVDCPFKMLATLRKDEMWNVSTEIGEHNHGPSKDPSVHPTLRRLTPAQLHKVNEMTNEGHSPTEILIELQAHWPNIHVLKRDIYNIRKKIKAEKEVADGAAVPAEGFATPNGSFPGPTPNGRWEWVPDGAEVKSKGKGKGRRQNAASVIPQPCIDPQLQNHSLSQPQPGFPQGSVGANHQFLRQAPGVSFMGNQDRTTPAGLEGPSAGPSTLNPPTSFGGADTTANHAPAPEDDPPLASSSSNLSNNLLAQFRPGRPAQPHATDTAVMLPATQPANANPPVQNPHAAPTVPTAQVLTTKIQRMEKELMDHKTILSQILQAVKVIHGEQHE